MASKYALKYSENLQNEVCRLCNSSLRVVYGNCVSKKSFINLFKPSGRQESLGVVWANSLQSLGINVENSCNLSQVLCNVCGRKIKNLCELFSYVTKGFGSSVVEERFAGAKRALLSPERSSPANRKSQRVRSPLKERSKSKKSLTFTHNQDAKINEKQLQDHVLSRLNIDDLDTTKPGPCGSPSSSVKVVIAYPNGRVDVKSDFDHNSLVIIRDTCLSRWRSVVNSIFRHEFIAQELTRALGREVDRECQNYCKSDSCLKSSEPDQLAVFSNKIACAEINIHCPILSSVLSSACGLNDAKIDENNAVNAIALATSTLLRCRNPTMSAIAYRISTILSHSGVSYQDTIRLNNLGVCMSPKRMIALQEKMGKNSDYKLQIWKKTIESNKCSQLFLEEVAEKQLPERADDDMDIIVDLDLTEDTIKDYHWYDSSIYQSTIEKLDAVRKEMNELTYTDDVLRGAQTQLQNERLPFYK